MGYDSNKDVAVMSICCNSGFMALVWDSGASAKVGDQVIAVGYPRASFRGVTATIGEVKNDWTGTALGYISHDAPLNPGNSGGPLFSIEGKVLGVNTASSRITEGLFYAVPYSTIQDEVADWKARLIIVTDATPTPTPRPSLTSTPTSTCPTAKERTYFIALLDALEPYASGATSLLGMLSEASDNPLLIFDDSWKIRLAVTLFTLNTGAEEILALDPPNSVTRISTHAELAAQKALRISDLMVRAIDRFDADALEEAVDLIASSINDVEAMGIAIESFCD